MKTEFILSLYERGFFEKSQKENDTVYHLKTPLQICVQEKTVEEIKERYLPDEEIGGIFWARPTFQDSEIVLIIDKVSYVRNAIEDYPRKDNNNKSNAYLADQKELSEAYNACFFEECIPLRFHSHPTSGNDVLDELQRTIRNWETSEQDRKVSEFFEPIDGLKLLLPQGLIVGYSSINTSLFIGFYNGLIAPHDFSETKKGVIEKKLNSIQLPFQDKQFTQGEKIGIAVGLTALLVLAIRYRKVSIPIIASLAMIVPVFLTNTQSIDKPVYYNKLGSGDATIFFPRVEDK